MQGSLAQDLEFLYGRDQVGLLLERIAGTVAKHRPHIPLGLAGAERDRLTERDAILIAYPDQVREDPAAPLLGLAHFVEDHLRGIVSGVHILPFYPSSSDDGFAVMDYMEVDQAFGGWPDIARLGGTCDLMFDAVFNHMSAGSRWFQCFLRDDREFKDFFVAVDGAPDLSAVVRPRALPLLTEFNTGRGRIKVWTTFSEDQVDLNFSNPQVLLAMIDVLLFYVTKGARFIRLDAIAFLWKRIGTSCLHLPQTHRVIQVVRRLLDLVAPKVVLITETNVPHAENLSYFGDGTNEAQLVYNFALPPLVLHSFITGNTDKLTRWAQSLSLPSDRVALFNFLASHDGIGLNPARGILTDDEIQALVDRSIAHGGLISYKTLTDGSRAPYELNINYFDALSNPAGSEPLEIQVARAICAHALMLAFPGLPAVYFHSLAGSRGDRTGAASSGMPRRINREKLRRKALDAELADFESLRARVFYGLKRLLGARKGQGAFAPGGGFEVLALDPRVFAILRLNRAEGSAGDEAVLCLQNVSGDTVNVDLRRAGGGGLPWRSILHPVTAGPAAAVETDILRVPPYGVWWGKGATRVPRPELAG